MEIGMTKSLEMKQRSLKQLCQNFSPGLNSESYAFTILKHTRHHYWME